MDFHIFYTHSYSTPFWIKAYCDDDLDWYHCQWGSSAVELPAAIFSPEARAKYFNSIKCFTNKLWITTN